MSSRTDVFLRTGLADAVAVVAGLRSACLLEASAAGHAVELHGAATRYCSVLDGVASGNTTVYCIDGQAFIVNNQLLARRARDVADVGLPHQLVAALHCSNGACEDIALPQGLMPAYGRRLAAAALQMLQQQRAAAVEERGVGSSATRASPPDEGWTSATTGRRAKGRATGFTRGPVADVAAGVAEGPPAVSCTFAALMAAHPVAAAATAVGKTAGTSPEAGHDVLVGADPSCSHAASFDGGEGRPASPCFVAFTGWLLEYPVLFDTSTRLDDGRAGSSTSTTSGSDSAASPGLCVDGEPLLLCEALYKLHLPPVLSSPAFESALSGSRRASASGRHGKRSDQESARPEPTTFCSRVAFSVPLLRFGANHGARSPCNCTSGAGGLGGRAEVVKKPCVAVPHPAASRAFACEDSHHGAGVLTPSTTPCSCELCRHLACLPAPLPPSVLACLHAWQAGAAQTVAAWNDRAVSGARNGCSAASAALGGAARHTVASGDKCIEPGGREAGLPSEKESAPDGAAADLPFALGLSRAEVTFSFRVIQPDRVAL